MSIQILQTGFTEESKRAWAWWNGLETQWKMAFNEAVLGKGLIIAPPKDEELVLMLTRANILRFVGSGGINPSLSFKLTNLSGLEGLKHLVSVTVSFCKLENLKGLQSHFLLDSLFVNNNQLQSLEGIERLVQLRALYANVNEIKSLKPLQKLTNLNTVYLNYNTISSLDGIREKHADRLRQFYILPNDSLPHKEIVQLQMQYGILCMRG